ncbi:hypothetical protein, partial [Candidatus Ichthyocystis hellenicum]|uniref:hypothetical protein n=1 Tax=Candidatus Ichthyocystis hellenicum TaxID=1561003 RepID=UPI001585A8C2
MNNISTYGGNNEQVDYGVSSIEVGRRFPLSSADAVAVPTSGQLPQYLYNWYGYVGNIETISEVCNDCFLQEYAVRCGYQLTEDFLSVMNKHKIKFVDEVDSILTNLYSSFNFLRESRHNLVNIEDLINNVSLSFSKKVYELRPKCIDVLRHDVIPAVIRIIFDSKVIDGSCERNMTYPEMEQLFLRFVTALEKLIMVKVMKYWSCFCNSNKDLLSLIPSVDYSNPFIFAHSLYGISDLNVNCLATFTNRFGTNISFMAIAKIDEMVSMFISKCNDSLRVLVNSKCSCICHYNCRAYDCFNELSDKFTDLAGEEFDRKIIEEEVKDKFINFLNNIAILNSNEIAETNRVLIFDSIVEYMRNLFLANTVSSDAYKIISNFQRGISLYQRLLMFGKDSSATKNVWNLKKNRWRLRKNRWGLSLHPGDDHKISSIERRFIIKSRKVVKDGFCSIIKEKGKFLYSSVDWDNISKKIFPIGTIRYIANDEHGELSRFLHGVRVIERIDMFDGYSAGTRKATPEEIDNILKISINRLYIRNIILFNRIRKNLIQNKKSNTSKDICLGRELRRPCKNISSDSDADTSSDSDIDNTLKGDDLLVTNRSVQSNLPVVTSMKTVPLVRRDKIINMWGLNLHPDDDKLIFFIRKKFSVQIKDHLLILFYDMLERCKVLPSGAILRNSSWDAISNELSTIAKISVASITEKQREELGEVLSKSRIVAVNDDQTSSCMRKVTDDEKKELMICADKLIDKRLKASIRSLWLRVVDKYSTNLGCNHEEKYEYDYSRVCKVGSLGVRLRHSDNAAIVNTRKKFLPMIKSGVYDKFSSMLRDKYEFSDGAFIGAFAWFRVSKKLIPIAEEEVKPILKNQQEELEEIVHKARVVVDSEVDRELTEDEKSIVLENIMKFVSASLKKLLSNSWKNLLISVRCDRIGVSDSISTTSSKGDCITEFTSSSSNAIDVTGAYSRDEGNRLKVRICHEDDNYILSIRRKFSSEIYNYASDRFSAMIKGGYKFDDGTALGVCAWKGIYRKVLPIIKNEVDVIVERERKEIGDALLRSRVDISLPSSDSTTITMTMREITSEESLVILETIMKSVHKQMMYNFGRIWNRIIRVPLEDLGDVSRVRLGKGREYLPSIEDRWGVKLHPKDDNNISFIRRKFIAESRKVIRDKFFSILNGGHKEKHKFLGISDDWGTISKELFPIAQETVRHLVHAEHEELSTLLSVALVIEDICIFDGLYAGTRKVTPEERDGILRISTSHVYNRNRELSSRIWKELISSKKFNIPRGTDFGGEFENDMDSLYTNHSVQTELPVVTSISPELLGKRDKIISIWKVNLHPDDDKIISFIIRKFSIQIRTHLDKLFCGMLESKTVLPSGVVLRDSSWTVISGELSKIATESVDLITKKQYEELDIALSKSRIVDVNKSRSSSCIIRKVTDYEKKGLMICAKKIMDNRMKSYIRLSWVRTVNKSSTDIGYGYKEKSKDVSGSGREGKWGVKLRYSDNISILSVRRKFSCRIKDVVRDKFSIMIRDKYKFDDGTFIGLFAWFRVSKKLFPIAKEEVNSILKEELEELEEVVSKSRTVVDTGVDRELTDEERSIVLKNIMRLVGVALKKLFSKTWDGLVSSLSGSFVDESADSEIDRTGDVPLSSSSNVLDTTEVDTCDSSGSLGVKLCYEDDIAILNIRKKFSYKINRCIIDKYSEIINKGHKFDDDTTIGLHLWGKVAKSLFPIISKEVGPIIENECMEISDVLLKSRVDISSTNSSGRTRVMREITSEERNAILETIMESVNKQVICNFGRVWNKIIKSPSVGLRGFREEYKSELDNIKLEFIGSLGPIVNQAVDSLSPDAFNIISEKSRSLFNEGGFLSRIEVLLSDARVADEFGNDRFITDEEKKCVLKKFMDTIDEDRDCLVRKRASKLKNLS